MSDSELERLARMEPTTARGMLLVAVKELMSVLVVVHEYDATELYDLADEVLRTVWENGRAN